MNDCKVSIIIPAYNEEKYVQNLMEALLEQTYQHIDIILVDNGSTDKTMEIAASFGALTVQNKEANISELRNIGASHAKGDILAFLDADCIPRKRWVESAVKNFKDKQVGATGCHCLIPENSTWVERAWFSSKPKGVRPVNFIGTANLFARKDIFEKLGGFNNHLKTGEDYEFCSRLREQGYVIKSDSDIEVVHLRGPKTLYDRFKKEIWYGLETPAIVSKNPLYLPFISSLFFIVLLGMTIVSIFFHQYSITLMSLVLLVTMISVICLNRCFKNGEFIYLFHLFPIFFCYLMGRSVSLFYILKEVLNKKVKS